MPFNLNNISHALSSLILIISSLLELFYANQGTVNCIVFVLVVPVILVRFFRAYRQGDIVKLLSILSSSLFFITCAVIYILSIIFELGSETGTLSKCLKVSAIVIELFIVNEPWCGINAKWIKLVIYISCSMIQLFLSGWIIMLYSLRSRDQAVSICLLFINVVAVTCSICYSYIITRRGTAPQSTPQSTHQSVGQSTIELTEAVGEENVFKEENVFDDEDQKFLAQPTRELIS